MPSIATSPNGAPSSLGPTERAELPYTRWLLLLALLVAELLAVTLWFDTGVLSSRHTWWAGVIGAWPLANQLLLAAAAAMIVFGGTHFRDELQAVADRLTVPPATWACLPIHVASLVATSLIAAHVLNSGLTHSNWPSLWVALWIAMTLVTLGLLLPLAIPAVLWPSLLRRGLPSILLGLGVGGGAWAAGYFTSCFWKPLSGVTLRLVAAILSWITPDPFCQANQLTVGTQRFHVQIAPGCSGYEGVGLIVVFLTVYLFLYRRTLRFPQALLLVPIGAAVIWAANVLRIAMLILIGTWVSPLIAMESFHSLAGWLSFIGVSLGLVVVAQRSHWFAVAAVPAAPLENSGAAARVSLSLPAEQSPANPINPYLAPMVVALVTGMVTGAFFTGFDPLYGLSVVAAGAVLWRYRRYYAAWDWRVDWASIAIGVAAYGCWIALIGQPHDTHRAEQLRAAMETLPTWGARLWIISRVLGAVVTVPLIEELTFRGFLTRRLIAARFDGVTMGTFSWFSFLMSSVLFGALHHSVLAGAAAGMLFALALYRRGRLSDAVAAHATTNALIAIQVLTTGAWHLWN